MTTPLLVLRPATRTAPTAEAEMIRARIASAARRRRRLRWLRLRAALFGRAKPRRDAGAALRPECA